jgi:hypothetical protein
MLSKKRSITTCIAVISVFIVLACQTASNMIYPATPIPNGTLQPISNYDGDWQGTTSQNLKITFTVTRGEIIVLSIRSTLIGVSCISTETSTSKAFVEPTALATGNFVPTNPIQNDTFTITVFNEGPGYTSSTLIGTFSSPNMASGTYEYTATGTKCNGTIMVDWSAGKVSH